MFIVFFTTICSVQRKSQLNLTVTLMKQYKFCFINANPWVHMFLIFYVTRKEVRIKHFCYFLDHSGCPKGQQQTVSILNEALLHETPLSLERLTDKWWPFRLEYLEDIFSKMNRWDCQSRKTTENICCQWFHWSFQGNIRILEILYPLLCTCFSLL